MSQLIALVATAVLINGVRTVIQPGEPLPDLSKHDARELVGSGAAEPEGAQAAQQRLAQLQELDAQEDFAEARKRALEEQQAREQAEAQAQAQAKADADAKAKADAEAQAKADADAKAKADAETEAQAKANAEAKAKADDDATAHAKEAAPAAVAQQIKRGRS
ncbi:hypothetical protein [Delftia deserti]|uniref:Colicin import membrane protein n=1 Tax=Delftia deserti TaxID=1651218 RepID=A0ABW5EJY1_9BURK